MFPQKGKVWLAKQHSYKKPTIHRNLIILLACSELAAVCTKRHISTRQWLLWNTSVYAYIAIRKCN